VAGEEAGRRELAGEPRTHNLVGVGSSPTRPTCKGDPVGYVQEHAKQTSKGKDCSRKSTSRRGRQGLGTSSLTRRFWTRLSTTTRQTNCSSPCEGHGGREGTPYTSIRSPASPLFPHTLPTSAHGPGAALSMKTVGWLMRLVGGFCPVAPRIRLRTPSRGRQRHWHARGDGCRIRPDAVPYQV